MCVINGGCDLARSLTACSLRGVLDHMTNRLARVSEQWPTGDVTTRFPGCAIAREASEAWRDQERGGAAVHDTTGLIQLSAGPRPRPSGADFFFGHVILGAVRLRPVGTGQSGWRKRIPTQTPCASALRLRLAPPPCAFSRRRGSAPLDSVGGLEKIGAPRLAGQDSGRSLVSARVYPPPNRSVRFRAGVPNVLNRI